MHIIRLSEGYKCSHDPDKLNKRQSLTLSCLLLKSHTRNLKSGKGVITLPKIMVKLSMLTKNLSTKYILKEKTLSYPFPLLYIHEEVIL